MTNRFVLYTVNRFLTPDGKSEQRHILDVFQEDQEQEARHKYLTYKALSIPVNLVVEDVDHIYAGDAVWLCVLTKVDGLKWMSSPIVYTLDVESSSLYNGMQESLHTINLTAYNTLLFSYLSRDIYPNIIQVIKHLPDKLLVYSPHVEALQYAIQNSLFDSLLNLAVE